MGYRVLVKDHNGVLQVPVQEIYPEVGAASFFFDTSNVHKYFWYLKEDMNPSTHHKRRKVKEDI